MGGRETARVAARMGTGRSPPCLHMCVPSRFSHVRPFVTIWTVACQTPLSMDSLGKNTGVDCHFLLQGIFLTQGSNSCLLSLLHWQMGSLPLAPHGKQAPEFFGWIKPKQPKGSLKGKTQ